PIIADGLHLYKAVRYNGIDGEVEFAVNTSEKNIHAPSILMLKQGVHPKIVSERLGHSNIGITLDVYSHVMPGLQEAAAMRFEEDLLSGSQLRPIVVSEEVG
ncbi:hypothetical protein ACFLX5_05145, partial [Chloroflexota bacterium]